MNIIRVKNGVPFKYGVLINEPKIGENEVCYWYGKQSISSDNFEIVDNANFGEFEVYRYRKCYEKLYADEIKKSINAWANLITEMNKHRKSEEFDEDIAGQFRTSY